MSTEQKYQNPNLENLLLSGEENKKIDKLVNGQIGKWAKRAGAAGVAALVVGGLYLLSKDKEGKRRYKLIIERVQHSKNDAAKLLNTGESLKDEATPESILEMIDILSGKLPEDEKAQEGLSAIRAFIKQGPKKNST